MTASGNDFADFAARVGRGVLLTAEEAEAAIGAMVTGVAAHDAMRDFLTAMAERGPTAAEIVGGARVLRASMIRIVAPEGAMDVCGTGGDGAWTLNVSTAVGFVVAACGVPVAKHGNRAMSSRSGSADVLEALGVRIGGAPEAAERCLHEAGICFMFAQTHHPAMKHVAAVRKELGFRTIFNLLGPLSNPAGVKRQLVGVYGPEWVAPVAHALVELGAERAWVVHGRDGLDEFSVGAATTVAALDGGQVATREVQAADAGLTASPIEALRGGTAQENATAIRALLAGEGGPFRDVVLLNAAAALVVAERASDLRSGAAIAAEAINSGAARNVLARLVAASNA